MYITITINTITTNIITMGITIQCPKCGRIWTYGGSHKVTVTCTDCLSKVEISKNIVPLKEQLTKQ
jgi:uncharacterized protein (DUF983 family)